MMRKTERHREQHSLKGEKFSGKRGRKD
jgi:hypothetical protein